jgi:DNA-binding transcriptional MerR regulator
MPETTYSVGELAALVGVSVRTLHHYDARGLLVPSGRGHQGYRRYDHDDLDRLQEILVWRRLGLALDEIAAILDDPAHDRVAVLRRQRDLLAAELHRLGTVHALVERTLTTLEEGTPMSDHDRFDGLDPAAWNERTHGAEVRARWGDTDAYAESTRRTGSYGPDEWAAIRTEGGAVEAAFVALLDAGVPADAPAAMDAAEQARRHVDRWFYPCSHELHAGLGDLYVSDPRFTAHYDDQRPGLAAYVRDAILANGLRAVG